MKRQSTLNRQKVTLATKFGILRNPADAQSRGFNGSAAYVKSACEASLKRLQTDVIDLYYLHRNYFQDNLLV